MVVLPEPVGPVTSMMPCGCWIRRSNLLSTSPLMPRTSSVNFDSALSSRRSTARSPCAEGSVETRTSIARPPMRSEMRPSCGSRLSAMSSSAMIFRREISAACSALVRLHHLAQRAVDAEAHRARALVGLDVDVARAVLRRLREQRVEHADDRRVVARPRAGPRSPAAPASCATGRPRSRPRRPPTRRSTRRRRRPRRCGCSVSADSRSKLSTS